MNVTPETFKPGERWLIQNYRNVIEVVCIEWSPSGKWVKYRAGLAALDSWIWTDGRIELVERLPDESANYKTGQAGGVEAPCGKCACCRWVIEKQRKKIYEAIEKGGIEYEGEEGKTFSVITGIEAEIEKRKRD